MKNTLLIILMYVVCSTFCYGRTIQPGGVFFKHDPGENDSSSAKKLQYGGLHQLGLVFGDRRSGTCFNFVNGVRFSRFFTGIGIDAQLNRNIDNYYSGYYSGNNVNNTSAVYADLRYYINKKKNFFAVVNGGANFIVENMESSDNFNYEKKTGYYTTCGLGFKAKLGKEVFYSFDLSYCIKQTRFNYNYINFINEWQTDKYDMRQYSILLRMGVELF